MYLPCADKIPFCSLSSKIILNLLKADKLASGLDHTIHTILDTFADSTIILQIKKLEIPFLYYSAFLPPNQHINKWSYLINESPKLGIPTETYLYYTFVFS